MINSTKVVNCRREKYDVYIGRPSVFGNPFVIGKDGDRDMVISKYEKYIRGRADLMALIPNLKDKKLGCFCHPLKCHGDVLVKLVGELDNEKSKR